MNKIAILGGVAVLALAIPAVAQMADHMQPQTRAEAEAKVRAHFVKVDVNKDGFVTPDEMMSARQAMRGEKMAGRFDRLDANHDGSVSRAEFTTAHDAMRGEHKGMMGMRGHGMGHGGGGMMARMAMRADTNADGKISQQEAVDGALKLFDIADTNHDKTLTMTERMAAREKMKSMMMMMHMRDGAAK